LLDDFFQTNYEIPTSIILPLLTEPVTQSAFCAYKLTECYFPPNKLLYPRCDHPRYNRMESSGQAAASVDSLAHKFHKPILAPLSVSKHDSTPSPIVISVPVCVCVCVCMFWEECVFLHVKPLTVQPQ
jgi:hypothetical protein